MKTLFWHDYETWGEDPRRDKPAQFAGLRTDENLEVVGEPVSFYCQPASDCLPKPDACLVTGITPQLALEDGLPDHQFTARVLGELSRPGTCGVGYNSIRFDDEVTRNGLFRNFHDPYEREWRNGNSRWDIIDVVRLCYALRPEGIEWPRREDGSPVFRLEALSEANGLAHENAHDALSDVYATLELARLVRRAQPRLYDYAYRLRRKRQVAELVDLTRCRPLLHISSKYPAASGCAALVVPLAPHPRNGNGIIAYDLDADPALLDALSAQEIRERLFTPQNELPEGVERVPLKVIHLNRSPMLVNTRLVDESVEGRLGLDKARCEENWQRLRRRRRADHALRDKLAAVFEPRDNSGVTRDPEASLYDGFIHDLDKPALADLREADGRTLAETTFSFHDWRLPELLFRYRARNFPETLSGAERQQWDEFRLQCFTEAGERSVAAFRQRIAELQAEAQTAERRELLVQLQEYEHSLTAGLL